MLILFDIDLTLVDTRGSGMRCLEDAGRALFGPGFSAEGIEYGGRLDPLIIHDLLINAGVDPSTQHAAALRAGYTEQMQAAYESGRAGSEALPGALELVASLAGRDGVTLGLLTGNFEATGTLKLRAAGFEMDPFEVRVWGDHSPHDPPHRSHLPPVGIERFAAMKGRDPDPQQVVVIGDTVHDVSCALDNGCRSLAVATGHHTADQLAGAGAHRVVGDLARTGDIV
ncbi:MAG: haloacid dehalogenase-like hydrolase, partial [Planctomycetota bacterium]